MRITYLSPYFWPEEIGSAPYCTELALFLSGKGHSVSTLAFRPHYPSVEGFSAWSDGARDYDTLDKVEVVRVPVRERGSGGFIDRIRNDIRYLWTVCTHSIRGRFRSTDTVVAYVPSILTLYGAKVIKLLTGARTVAVVHDIESGLASSLGITRSRGMLRIMQFVERVGLNLTDQVVVLTDGMKRELETLGCRRPITVLPIWASVGPNTPIQLTARPKLMYSGNFGKKQNLDQLLPLLKRLSDEEVAVDVILRGDGSEKSRIEAEIQNLGIGNVRFLPLAPSDQFMDSLQSANIHLVPQALNVANYALPSKLVSIMSSGRPFICIAEKDSPLDQLSLSSGAALCIPPGQNDLLFAAVTDLLKNPPRQEKMGQNGQAFVRKHMDKDAILSEYERIIVAVK
ncbi:glycosyltransferase family 4 protein [Puniceibacterium confluentis]|uniref:glycosyltransferase family 4 protein n=1 Tax=Puniceibacterium confluentis TaxID=1958944 RepID=UPI0011B775F9|nr:glycosyltransferase family 4 protein [Puniceibacterium confluentis]